MDAKEREQFGDFLRGKGCRVTEERLRLLDGIKHERGHFNVDDLVRRLRKGGLEVSRDTVYRNIPILLEAGVLEQSFKTRRDTFYESAKKKKHHDHILCRKCEKVVEFEDPSIEKAQRLVADRRGFKLEYHCHQLIGVCKKCRK
ncbi:MAG TPA: Fur family transcriptional regulator [Candidatus Omnitrophota bacterium]|nr:Fur family transcriptional regulator [Candidatus Omnitrophota bacterium]HPS36906.1 Fur family transcriptional regulator [Candidatus Omnitrophota bacterium]